MILVFLRTLQVVRHKNTWNCQFRNGVVTVDSDEKCFRTAAAKFSW